MHRPQGFVLLHPMVSAAMGQYHTKNQNVTFLNKSESITLYLRIDTSGGGVNFGALFH